MNLKLLGRYLLGDREAIRAVAADPKAIWLGLLFVFGAAFAREYDAEYLLAEPWHLLVPLVASLVSATLLHLVLALAITIRRKGHPGALALYRSWLGLFWMTAPLAWLYAIPYERMFSDVGAVKANLITLGIVAAWRVILMIRVVQVIYGTSVLQAIFPLMLFADVLAMVAIFQLDARILAIMGGVRLSPAESVLRSVATSVMILGYLSFWLWAIGSLVVFVQHLVRDRTFPQPPPQPSMDADRGPWIAGGVVIGVGLLLLPLTQAAQAKRHAVEGALAAKDYDRVVELLCANPQSAFPARWDPPPRDRSGPQLLEVCERLIARDDTPRWVIESYSAELGQGLGTQFGSIAYDDPNLAKRTLELLLRWPDPDGLDDARAAIREAFDQEERERAWAKEGEAPKPLPHRDLWKHAAERLGVDVPGR